MKTTNKFLTESELIKIEDIPFLKDQVKKLYHMTYSGVVFLSLMNIQSDKDFRFLMGNDIDLFTGYKPYQLHKKYLKLSEIYTEIYSLIQSFGYNAIYELYCYDLEKFSNRVNDIRKFVNPVIINQEPEFDNTRFFASFQKLRSTKKTQNPKVIYMAPLQ